MRFLKKLISICFFSILVIYFISFYTSNKLIKIFYENSEKIIKTLEKSEIKQIKIKGIAIANVIESYYADRNTTIDSIMVKEGEKIDKNQPLFKFNTENEIKEISFLSLLKDINLMKIDQKIQNKKEYDNSYGKNIKIENIYISFLHALNKYLDINNEIISIRIDNSIKSSKSIGFINKINYEEKDSVKAGNDIITVLSNKEIIILSFLKSKYLKLVTIGSEIIIKFENYTTKGYVYEITEPQNQEPFFSIAIKPILKNKQISHGEILEIYINMEN